MNKERMDELFLKACKGIIKQKKQSINVSGTCVYRGDNNLKCAVGQIIPDKMYDDNMEFKSFRSLCFDDNDWVNDNFAKHFGYDSQKEMGRYVNRDAKDGHVFGQLQLIHDDASNDDSFVTEFKRGALKLARKFKLKGSIDYLENI